ncbi:MAG: hypothetical protein KF708_18155 [Pirellulales bacterium]|nr:hypothetical protein [Pirellulales bacterium]
MRNLLWLLLCVVTFAGCAPQETAAEIRKRKEKERAAELKEERAKNRERRFEAMLKEQREFGEEMRRQQEQARTR